MDGIVKRLGVSVDKILEAAGDQFTHEARSRSPIKTGRLMASIGHKTSGEGIWDKVPAGLRVGTNVVYAAVQEFREDFYHASGQAHFMRDGAMATAEKMQDISVKELRWMR